METRKAHEGILACHRKLRISRKGQRFVIWITFRLLCCTLSNAVEHARGWVAKKIGFFDIIIGMKCLVLCRIVRVHEVFLENFFISSEGLVGSCQGTAWHGNISGVEARRKSTSDKSGEVRQAWKTLEKRLVEATRVGSSTILAARKSAVMTSYDMGSRADGNWTLTISAWWLSLQALFPLTEYRRNGVAFVSYWCPDHRTKPMH